MSTLQEKPAAPQGAEELPAFSVMPTAEEYAAQARTQARLFLLGGGLLAGLVAAAFVAFGLDNIFLPIALLLAVLTPILLWRFPRLTFYFTLVAASLFELSVVIGPDGQQFSDSLTDRVPIFWNVNTIFQFYAHTNFKGVPLNLFEIFILIAGVCSCLRAVYNQNTNLRGGPLLLPISVYMAFVLMGWVNGMVTGGDFKISLQEVRPQLYFGLAYLLAVNMVRERRHLLTLLWITVACVGLKAVLLTFRRYVTMHGLPLPDQGVGAHEEAFFLNAFLLLLIALTLCRALPRLRWLMWSLVPFVVLGNLALNRRAATAALIFVVPLLFLAAYQALPARRRLVAVLGVTVAVAFAIYYPAFKNSDSLFAQPARAVKSNFEPDARDASSDAARDSENIDLMATIKSAPLQGYGYGRPYFQIIPLPEIVKIYELEPFIPHNQILWIWERVGSFGFLAFWMMISAILIFAGQAIRAPGADGLVKAVGIFALLTTAMLVIFGLLDLQLSCFRVLLFTGIWAGALAALPTLRGPSLEPGVKAAT